MASVPILLNGVAYTPKDIEESIVPIGVEFAALNGRRRFADRNVVKHDYKLTFEGLTITQVIALRALYALHTSFVYRDENLISYTVLARKPLTNTRPIIGSAPVNEIRYAATLTLEEV